MSRFWNALAIAAACSSTLGLLIVMRSGSLGFPGSVSGAVIPKAAIAQNSEAIALQNYRQATEFAQQAVAAFKSANNADTSALKLEFRIQERSLWQKALQKLEAVSPSSALYARSLARKAQYERLLTTAEGKIAKANDEGFILGIIQDANVDPQGVHVTLCQLEGQIEVPTESRSIALSDNKASSPASTTASSPASTTASTTAPSVTPANRQSPHFLQRSFWRQPPTPAPTKEVAIAPPERFPGKASPSPLPLEQGQLNREYCRHHQGEKLMASPASLIKIPIAIVLAHKTAEVGTTAPNIGLAKANAAEATSDSSIDLNQKIYIDPGNFTENAAGAVIEIGQEYSLRKVMSRMIMDSDNIATNQLIDYLGYANIGQSLKQMGYSQTLVGHKLAGNQVMPQDIGISSNQSSTHEITAMMAQIYTLDTPANRDIMAALHHQTDRELGYEALTGEPTANSTGDSTGDSTANALAHSTAGLEIKWLGEKTGQNAEMLASTLAMRIGEDDYVLTVAIDNDSNLYGLRQIIRGIADHLSQAGPLMP